MITLLTRETFQVIHVAFGAHYHFKRRYGLVARGTQASRPEQSAFTMTERYRTVYTAQRTVQFDSSVIGRSFAIEISVQLAC